MFCPDGFETLATTYHRVGTIAMQWSRKQPRIEGPKITEDMTEPEATRWEAYRAWLWCHFVHSTAGQLFATSPHGNALKLDMYAGNFWVALEEEFPDDPIGQRKLARRNGDVFYTIRPGSFTIDVHHTPSDNDRPDLNNLLKTWQGWPVCWKPLANQMTDEGLRALLCDQTARELRGTAPISVTPPRDLASPEIYYIEAVEASLVRKIVGRPSKQRPIRKVYTQLFPNGHGDAHWSTVTKKINDAGVVCSQRTVQRAISEIS